MPEPMDPLTWSILAAAIAAAYLLTLKLSHGKEPEQPAQAETAEQPLLPEPQQPTPPQPEPQQPRQQETTEKKPADNPEKPETPQEDEPQPEIELIEPTTPPPSLQPILQTTQNLQKELHKLKNLLKTQKS